MWPLKYSSPRRAKRSINAQFHYWAQFFSLFPLKQRALAPLFWIRWLYQSQRSYCHLCPHMWSTIFILLLQFVRITAFQDFLINNLGDRYTHLLSVTAYVLFFLIGYLFCGGVLHKKFADESIWLPLKPFLFVFVSHKGLSRRRSASSVPLPILSRVQQQAMISVGMTLPYFLVFLGDGIM